MRRIGLAAGVVVALLMAHSAAAVTLVGSDGVPIGGAWQRWVDSARVPTVPCNVVVSRTDPNGHGRAYMIPGEMTIYVPPGYQLSRFTLLHELGHAYDYAYLSDADRQAIMSAVLGNYPGREWRDGSPTSASEQFAESYRNEAEHRIYRNADQWTWGYSAFLTRREFWLLRGWLINIPRLATLAHAPVGCR